MIGRRNDLETIEIDLVDDFGEPTPRKRKPRAIKPDKPIHMDWTIVNAFDTINRFAPGSLLDKDLFFVCAEAFDYLQQRLGLNAMQCIIVALMLEEGRDMTFKKMGAVLGLSRLNMLTHYKDIDDLFRMRWVMHTGHCDSSGYYDCYTLAKGVISAVRENRPFVPESLECKDNQEFVEKLAHHIMNNFEDDDTVFDDDRFWLQEFVETNKELPVCEVALSLNDPNSLALFMLAVADYCNFAGCENEGLCPDEVKMVYPRERTPNFKRVVKQLQDGTHPLFLKNLIEFKCENGMANPNKYVVTSHVKGELLSGFVPYDMSKKRLPKVTGLITCDKFTPKELFYNEKEGREITRLRDILSQEQLPVIQERLKEKGLRTGVCVLMHGYPGTGKTATAYELARQTGRDIIEVHVTDFKDKYVGESEAKLKQIFNNYRRYCESTDTMPILLLNEGDAILSKRLENVEHGTEQMMNSLQNILLEEMENLKGIMIVTTNLTCNLDKAFERRFIFKIQFEKPCNEAKAHIWKSMIDNLKDDEARELARLYDVTGGEIENIARKSTMEYILTGQQADFETIKQFTQQEKLEQKRSSIIGFGGH